MNINKHFLSKMIIVLAMVFFSFSIPTLVSADEMPIPQKIVKDASEQMMKTLKDNKAELEKDPDLIYGIVTNILTPYFDFTKMAKLSLGKNWRRATVQQQRKFTNEFRLLLIRTYSTAMLEYTNQEIRFSPFHDDLATKRVKVEMDIIQANGPSIPMLLSMYQNNENEWKVYDVKIDGISLVTNYRSTFATEIRNGGMDKLIENLASRNEKVKV